MLRIKHTLGLSLGSPNKHKGGLMSYRFRDDPICIMEINIPSIPDEKIPIGTLVILWNNIPVVKIGEMLYEVYKEGSIPIVEVEEPKLLRPEMFRGTYTEEVPFKVTQNLDNVKFRKTAKGSKRVRPWESPKYF